MRIPFNDLVDYFIERPWGKWMKIDTQIFGMKCVCDSDLLRDGVEPFFRAYDVPTSITFSEFYERFGVDLHMFVCEVDTLNSIDFNRTSHPDAPVLEAAIMSSLIPPIYRPHEYKGRYYMDGGFGNNFPAFECVQHTDPSTVLALQNDYAQNLPSFDSISAPALYSHIVWQLVLRNNGNDRNIAAANRCKYYIVYRADNMMAPDLWEQFLGSQDSRRAILESGRATAREYFTAIEHC